MNATNGERCAPGGREPKLAGVQVLVTVRLYVTDDTSAFVDMARKRKESMKMTDFIVLVKKSSCRKDVKFWSRAGWAGESDPFVDVETDGEVINTTSGGKYGTACSTCMRGRAQFLPWCSTCNVQELDRCMFYMSFPS